MHVSLLFTEQQYRCVRKHLFRGKKEQGCFLFVDGNIGTLAISLKVRDIHIVNADGWSYQSGFHLELDEMEKVKVMLKAREYDCALVECHSHRFNGEAYFSSSDVHGLEEFVRYVWWKLPGKIYGAVVFTKSDTKGQIWLPKHIKPLPLSEINIINAAGKVQIKGEKLLL